MVLPGTTLAFVAVLVSCDPAQQVQQKPDWVSTQWANSMAAYNILPIYPPSEDVHIGDIYAYRLDEPTSDGNLFRSVKLDYVSQQAALEEYYGNVPVMPSTSDDPGAGKIWRQMSAGDVYQPINSAKRDISEVGHATSDRASEGKQQGVKENKKSAEMVPRAEHAERKKRSIDPESTETHVSIFKRAGTMERLPLVAFPGFNLAHADVESLAGSVPLRFFQAVFGASRRAKGSISVKISSAETYGIPVMPAAVALRDYCESDTGEIACSSGFIQNQMRALGPISFATPVAVSMINRLYLARTIEYTYEASTAEGAQSELYVNLQRSLDNQKALLAEISAKGASAVAVASASAPSETVGRLTDIKSSLDDVLRQIQSTNQQFGNSPVPGVSFTIGRIDAQGVTLIQTFERPIAVGYRAVALPARN